MKRTLSALLIAPLIPAALFAPGAGLLVAVAYAYLFCALLGLPVFFILKRAQRETHATYALAGLILGGICVLIPALFSFQTLDLNALLAAFLFGVLGGAVGLTFSAIRGPERKTA